MEVRDILREGVEITEEIERLKNRLEFLKGEIEAHFKGDKGVERIEDNGYIAVRRVINKWIVDEKVEELKEDLGNKFDKFFIEKKSYKAAGLLKKMVKKSQDMVNKLMDYVWIDRQVSIKFKRKEKKNGKGKN